MKKFNAIQFLEDMSQMFTSKEHQIAKCKDQYEVAEVLEEITKDKYSVEAIYRVNSNEYEYILVGKVPESYSGIDLNYNLDSKEIDYGYLSKAEIDELV